MFVFSYTDQQQQQENSKRIIIIVVKHFYWLIHYCGKKKYQEKYVDIMAAMGIELQLKRLTAKP